MVGRPGGEPGAAPFAGENARRERRGEPPKADGAPAFCRKGVCGTAVVHGAQGAGEVKRVAPSRLLRRM